ncbi:type II toxin-antitoxin system RelE/ParE family toxin [Escherichia coli]
MPAFEWVHVQLHQQKGMISLSPPTICNSALLTHPRMGEQLFQFEPREIRRIFAGEYEIRYELNGQTIYVLRLWHTRENR